MAFSVRTVLILLAAAAAFTPVPVWAGGDEVLYGQAPPKGDLAFACFARHYDRAHLAAHPDQHVTDMVTLAYRADGDRVGESAFNMTLRFRKAPEDQQFPSLCRSRAGSERVTCSVECDGGSFTVTRRSETSILVDLSGGIGTCDGDLPDGTGFGSDDKVFRLDSADMTSCRDLVWDDELRPRLLKRAGIAP